jgi:hypothetical protein
MTVNCFTLDFRKEVADLVVTISGELPPHTARPFAFTASKSPARAGPRSSWFRLIVEDSASLSMPADRGWLGQFE